MGASESKLAFKRSIFKLDEGDIAPGDDFWSQFYTLPESYDDVSSLCSPNDLRNITACDPANPDRPKQNLETLIYTLVARLRYLQDRVAFDNVSPQPATEILNCMRILTRLLPYIYEAEHLREWQDRFLWQPRKPTCRWSKKDAQYFDGLDPSRPIPLECKDDPLGPPLGELLVETTINYLFVPDFTIPKRYKENGDPDYRVTPKVWTTGIGSKQSLGCSKVNEMNQMETIRLMLAITSSTLYMASSQIPSADIKPLTYAVTRLDLKLVHCIVCSLMNTVLKYQPNPWVIPAGLSASPQEPKKLLVTFALQCLLVLVVYNPPSTPGSGVDKNLFRHSLSSLHRPDDFQFIQQGLSHTLSQPISGSSSIAFSGRDKILPWTPEMISLLWELLQCNKRFRRYLIETGCILDHVIILLYYATDAKDDPTKHGLLRMCIFVLQTISAEANFARKLNKQIKHAESLPPILKLSHFHGSYGDFLICTIKAILVSTKALPEVVCPALMAIIVNIAPYQRNLRRATAANILELFDIFSSPGFLLAAESNHHLLSAILVAISSILNNAEFNPRFVIVLASGSNRLKGLRDFAFENALAELDREMQDRKDRFADLRASSGASRAPSFDNARSPTATQAPTLDSVPEDERFVLDDDETDPAHDPNASDQSTPTPATPRTALSDKALGKRPAHNLTLSRTSSATSLPTLATFANSAQKFRPTQDWLDSWYPHLPIEAIMDILDQPQIQHQAAAALHRRQSSTTDVLSPDDPANPPPSSLESPDWTPRQSLQAPRSSGEGWQYPVATPVLGFDGATAEQDAQLVIPSTPPLSFEWTPVAVGWYHSLLWSCIYLQEAAAFQGSSGLYSATNIALFKRGSTSQEISLRRPKGAIDAVGNSIVSRFGGMNLR